MAADTSIQLLTKFKKLARELKRALQIKHCVALELLARAEGFSNYHEVAAIAGDRGKLPVRRTTEQVAASLMRIARERATQEDGVDALKEVAALCDALCAAPELHDVSSEPLPAVETTEPSTRCVRRQAVAFSDGRRMEVRHPVAVSYRRCRRPARPNGAGAGESRSDMAPSAVAHDA